MIRQLLTLVILSTIISAEEMPIMAKPGQCFTKSFFPPESLKTVRNTSTKRVIIRKSSLKHEVIPAKYKWITKKVKVSDGTEKIVVIPTLYKEVQEKILVEPAKKVWRKGLEPNAPKAFNSCVQSASLAGMKIENAKVGSCFYEHFKPEKYITTSEKILVSEPSKRIITTPAEYRTYTKKITTDATTSKLVPVVAKYKKVKEKVVVAPAHSEWQKTTCQNRGCNQSEVVCLIEVPKQYKEITKKVLLQPSVAKRIAISPIYKDIEIQEISKHASSKEVPIPPTYSNINKKKKIKDALFFWSDMSHKDINSRIVTECDKICLTEIPAKYKTIKKKVVVTPAHTKLIKTPPKYAMIKIKKILKPASFKKIVVPAEYKSITIEKERTKGFAKWIPIVCESNMTTTTIKKVQEALKKAGFYHGEINGVWDLESKLATREYQRANNLTITRLSIETMKSLGIY